MNTRPPLPPFTRESAIAKSQAGRRWLEQPRSGEVALAYTLDTHGATVQIRHQQGGSAGVPGAEMKKSSIIV